MKFTIICCLATFYLYVVTDKKAVKSAQMTNNCEFHVLLLIFKDEFVTV